VVARLLLWSIADAPVSLDEVREAIPESERAVWFTDEATERVGSFTVFADADAAAEPVPRQLRELIGKDPDIVELFDIE
jgi:hypothetical protein